MNRVITEVTEELHVYNGYVVVLVFPSGALLRLQAEIFIQKMRMNATLVLPIFSIPNFERVKTIATLGSALAQLKNLVKN